MKETKTNVNIGRKVRYCNGVPIFYNSTEYDFYHLRFDVSWDQELRCTVIDQPDGLLIDKKYFSIPVPDAELLRSRTIDTYRWVDAILNTLLKCGGMIWMEKMRCSNMLFGLDPRGNLVLSVEYNILMKHPLVPSVFEYNETRWLTSQGLGSLFG